MSTEQPPSDEHPFTISHIPGVDPVALTRGDLLLPNEHRIAGIFHSLTDHLSEDESGKISGEALKAAGYSWGTRQAKKAYFGTLALQNRKPPADREFFRHRNDGARAFVEDLIGRFMADDSVLHGAEHLPALMKQQRESGNTIVMANHGSEVDPLVLSIMLDRMFPSGGRREIASTAQEMRDKLVAITGHKVMLDSFRRAFARSIHTVFTIARKYRTDLSDEDAAVVGAYMRNVNTVLQRLIASPAYVPMIFPEGGRTRNDRVAMQPDTVYAAKGKTVVPAFIDMPDDFMHLEKKTNMRLQPVRTDVYLGEPFLHTSGGTGGTETFVGMFVDRLRSAGAPVGRLAWGFLRRTKTRNEQGRECTEEFQEVAARDTD